MVGDLAACLGDDAGHTLHGGRDLFRRRLGAEDHHQLVFTRPFSDQSELPYRWTDSRDYSTHEQAATI